MLRSLLTNALRSRSGGAGYSSSAGTRSRGAGGYGRRSSSAGGAGGVGGMVGAQVGRTLMSRFARRR